MRVPDWRKLVLNEGIVPEPITDADRIALWLPGSHDSSYRHWQRIANVGRAPVTVEDGLCATVATAVGVRQPIHSFFGKLVQRFRGPASDHTWIMPNGEAAEQHGERQNDLLLVWSEGEAPLDEPRIKAHWPACTRVQKLGNNLFLVAGIQPPEMKSEAPLPELQGSPREFAEKSLATVRRSGDRRKEASALTDLGAAYLRDNDAGRAVPLLEAALDLARQVGDRTVERDVLDNLGMAVLAQGQAPRALPLFEQALAYAREASDRFAEKNALEHLGMAYARLSDVGRCLAFMDQAVTLAREVGDRQHQADLLWSLAILHAELGQRDQAIARGQAAVDVLKAWGKPQAGVLAENLEKYRQGGAGVWAAASGAMATTAGGSIITSGWGMPASAPSAAANGPGLLRMAFSAMKSLGKFVGSGMKTVSAEAYQRRLRTCATCEHHTGLRCKLCGCFTAAKARLPHEDCPASKWPVETAAPTRVSSS